MGTATPLQAYAATLIALDWGTTMLRAYLLNGDGHVLGERVEHWGIMHLGSRDFASACRDVTAQWTSVGEVPVIAAGMVGSASGWLDVPYCAAPVGASELAAALMRVPSANVHIVPGVSQLGAAPDVMRGEETQAIGAIAAAPELSATSLLVFPGTHSKWVRVRNGAIAQFTTYMTGELFAVLRSHSILGRPAGRSAVTLSPDAATSAFSLGVATARDSSRSTEALLFSARSRVLVGGLGAAASLEYLSGILIGGELRSEIAEGSKPDALVGDAALCARYADALGLFGIANIRIIESAAPAGLWRIAAAAGLCARAVISVDGPK